MEWGAWREWRAEGARRDGHAGTRGGIDRGVGASGDIRVRTGARQDAPACAMRSGTRRWPASTRVRSVPAPNRDLPSFLRMPRRPDLHALLAPPERTPPPSAYTAAERRLISRLRTPRQVQRYLRSLPYNWEHTLYSFRGAVAAGRAHCLEAVLFAAAKRPGDRPPPDGCSTRRWCFNPRPALQPGETPFLRRGGHRTPVFGFPAGRPKNPVGLTTVCTVAFSCRKSTLNLPAILVK